MRKEKKGTKKILFAGVAAMLMTGIITGCGSSSTVNETTSNETFYKDTVADAYDMYEETYNYGLSNESAAKVVDDSDYEYADEESVQETGEAKGSSPSKTTQVINVNDNKKIIKTYDYRYETEEFDKSLENLKELIEKYGGYVASSDLSGTTRRCLYLTAKIPADASDNFVKNTGSLGTLTSQSENAEDVTLEYTDTESRISSLKTEQQRLNELLKDADSLETVIALEDRLTEVRYELESYQSRKNQLDSLITYSTVNIELKEVNYTVEVDDSTFVSRIVTGLKASLRDVKISVTDFAVWFIVNIPYFLIWIVVIFVIVKIIKAFVRRMRRKKQEKADRKIQMQQEAQGQMPDKEAEAHSTDRVK